MKLGFHGAARTVTGSKHLLSLNNGRKYLLDCGMFQGMGADTDDLNETFGFDPSAITALFLSHAHIDHSGLIPKLVKDGFTGPVYCTPATKDLAKILLLDSAEIQTYEAEIINKKRLAKGKKPYEPLYTVDDVAHALELFQTIPYNKWFKVDEDVRVMFSNAGHLIGSAVINLKVKEKRKLTRVAFSGDVGRYRSALLQPPAEFPQADYIILEGTYGDKMHDFAFNTIDKLHEYITKTLERGGKVIIPAFSVGRTQEILYALNQLELEKRLPEVNYFVDSPLSTKATEVIKSYTEEFNHRLQEILKIDDDPFMFKGLKYVENVEDSRQLVNYKEPCVIISASGTADAGRVRHHIHSCVHEQPHTILMAGYCSGASLGGQLLSGANEVEIYGELRPVAAQVDHIKSMSAHADADDLLRFISCQDAQKVKKVFLVHGEMTSINELAARLERKGFEGIEMPYLHSTHELK